MKRRNAIIAMLAASAGLMSHKAVMASDKSTSGATTLLDLGVTTQNTMTFNLASFDRFDFFLGKQKVSLSPAEIMAALQDR